MRRRKTVGADGKLVSQPDAKQRNFTTHIIHKTTASNTRPYDARYQLSPGEIEYARKFGSFMTEWRKLRGEK